MSKVIARKNLPVRLPLFPTITLWLLLDKLQSPGYVWGIVGTLMALIWIAAIFMIIKEKEVNVLENK